MLYCVEKHTKVSTTASHKHASHTNSSTGLATLGLIYNTGIDTGILHTYPPKHIHVPLGIHQWATGQTQSTRKKLEINTTNLNVLYVPIAKLILSHNIASKHLNSLYSNVRQELSALMTVLIFRWGRRHQREKGLLNTVWGHTHPPDLWALFSIHQHENKTQK